MKFSSISLSAQKSFALLLQVLVFVLMPTDIKKGSGVSAIPIFLQFFLPSFCYHISDLFATLYFVNLVSGRLKAHVAWHVTRLGAREM